MTGYDELKIYRGKPIVVNSYLTVTIPTIEEITEFGEKEYFNAVRTLTAVGADLKWQLWDMGIDYTKIRDYELFVKLIYRIIGSKKDLYLDMQNNPEKYDEMLSNIEMDKLLINPLQLVIKDLDFSDFKPCVNESQDIVLYNQDKDIVFDKVAYFQLVDIIRKIHGFKRNGEIPANERTKMDLIEDARDDSLAQQNKPFESILKPLVSTLQVECGQCGDDRIWQMPISTFLENIKRIGAVNEAKMLLQGAYSGFANLKDVDKKRLDMFRSI